MDVNDEGDWTNAQYQDQLAHEQEVISLLGQAQAAGTPRAVIRLLAIECGVAKHFNNEEARK